MCASVALENILYTIYLFTFINKRANNFAVNCDLAYKKCKTLINTSNIYYYT